MYTFLLILFVLVCFALVVVILLQAGKGQGLAGTFGGPGAGAVFGGRGAATFLSKSAGILATIYLALCVLIGDIDKSLIRRFECAYINTIIDGVGAWITI